MHQHLLEFCVASLGLRQTNFKTPTMPMNDPRGNESNNPEQGVHSQFIIRDQQSRCASTRQAPHPISFQVKGSYHSLGTPVTLDFHKRTSCWTAPTRYQKVWNKVPEYGQCSSVGFWNGIWYQGHLFYSQMAPFRDTLGAKLRQTLGTRRTLGVQFSELDLMTTALRTHPPPPAPPPTHSKKNEIVTLFLHICLQ